MSTRESPQLARSATSAFTEEQRRDLDVNGFVVLPGILSDTECDLFCDALEDAWEKSDKITWDYGTRCIYNVLQYTTIFEKCLLGLTLLAALQSVIGLELRLSLFNGRIPGPGAGLQPLHDLKRRRGRPFDKCATIWCLDEFTQINGAPRVLPGSHLTGEPFISRCTDPLQPHPDERYVTAPRGAVVVHNSFLIHSGTMNRSTAPRHSLLSAFTTPESAQMYKNKYYSWDELPAHIRQQLNPYTLQMLGLQ